MKWWFLISLLGLGSCLPIPQLRTELVLPPVTYRSSPLTVQTEYVSVPGYEEPHTPEIYNQSYYLRYYRPEDSLDTVFILMPGIFGGATSVDMLARLLVASTPGLEVWAVDRRANALEDRSAMVAALEARDPDIAYRYYIQNVGKPDGFQRLRAEDVSFMGYWGLEVHLRDLHELVRRANDKAATVILGGHSLGASIVGFYAAFDLDEGDTGYRHIDGLVLIDGGLGRTGGYGLTRSSSPLYSLLPTTEGLEATDDAPFLTFGLEANMYARREAMALLARFRPDDLAPEAAFPVTNRAALGIAQDDSYGGFTLFSSSLGEAVGAELSGNLLAFLSGGRQGAYSQSVKGVAPGHDYVDWTSGDTPPVSEVDALARSWATSDSNRSEWYFPLRLALDMGEADLRFDGSGPFAQSAEITTPTLAVGAGRGMVTSTDVFGAYSNTRPGSFFSSYILPEYTHLDIVEASDNPFVSLFKLWLRQVKALP